MLYYEQDLTFREVVALLAAKQRLAIRLWGLGKRAGNDSAQPGYRACEASNALEMSAVWKHR